MKRKITLLLTAVGLSLFSNLYAQVPFVFDVENRVPTGSCNVAAGNTNTNNSFLPDPFSFTTGGRVSTFDDWTCRRNQIKSDIENYEIGPKQPRPSTITATYSGGRLTVNVTENGQTLTLTSTVTMPSGTGPFPVVIGMNAPSGQLSSSLFNGIIQIPFNHDQVVSYAGGSGSINSSDPYFKLYPSTSIGKYSAWSWGISRLIDGLEIVQAQMKCNLEKIAVTGCSYAGKMALFAGAFDERIALTIAQESGGGGINSWRTSQAFTTRTGTNIEKIDNTNYSWFKSSMRNLNPTSLPHDHHELITMIAPRAFLALGNPGFEWLGDESGYKSSVAALEVWKAMGVEDRFGFDFTGGHNHCAAANQQNTSVTTFLNRFLRNTSTTSNVRINPNQSGFNLSMNSVINWTTPEISFNTNGPQVTITSPTSTNVEIGEEITVTAGVQDKNNDVTKVEFFVDDVKIGEDVTAPYTFSWSSAIGGQFIVSAKATDAENNTGSASVNLTVRIPQSPYGGTAHQLPGVIQFEEFDLGGNGLAYLDNTAGSAVTPLVNFRTNEDVDIEVCTDEGGGYNIGYGTAGEWLEYTVDVNGSGTYDIDIRVACDGAGRSITLEMDGEVIAENVQIPNTGGWQTWQTITLNDIQISTGKQIMRVTIGATDYVNLNHITFSDLITGQKSVDSKELSYYPNPFTESMTIQVAGEMNYSITNLTGVVVEKGILYKSSKLGGSLPSGYYILSLQSKAELKTFSIIKK